MRVGLLFGSFNPIHNGHLAIAEKCIEENLVDIVHFVVAYQNPFKSEYEVSYWDRVGIAEEAISYRNNFVVDTIEYDLRDSENGVKTYTVINSIKSKPFISKHEHIIICGDDVYNNIKKWYRGVELFNENKFIVFTRDSKEKVENDNIISYIDISGFENYSSSKVRKMVKNNEDITGLVPNNVKKIIEKYEFYK